MLRLAHLISLARLTLVEIDRGSGEAIGFLKVREGIIVTTDVAISLAEGEIQMRAVLRGERPGPLGQGFRGRQRRVAWFHFLHAKEILIGRRNCRVAH